MNSYIVDCENFFAFTAMVKWAIMNGMHFKADAVNYVIRFTGAF